MTDKTIVLTGANGGLGEAFMQALLEQKPKKIYAAARHKESLKNYADDPRVEIVALDITQQDSIDAMMQQVADVDVLINNAGINSNAPLFSADAADLEVNYKGTARLTRAFFEQAKNKKMQFINISSIVALCNLPLMAEYSISKSALHSFTQALRAELSPYGSEVYEVFPGPIDTRLTEGSPMPKAAPSAIVEAVLEAVAKKEFEIYPDDFAKMIQQKLKEDPQGVVQEFALSVQ